MGRGNCSEIGYRIEDYVNEYYIRAESLKIDLGCIARIRHAIFVRYLTDLACHPSHAFGYGFWGYLTNLAVEFDVLSLEFGMPFA